MQRSLFYSGSLGSLILCAAGNAAAANASPVLVIEGYSVVSVEARRPSSTKKTAKVGVTVSIRNPSTVKTAEHVFPIRVRVRLAGGSGAPWTWTCSRFDDLTNGRKKTVKPGEVFKNTYSGKLIGMAPPGCGKKVDVETQFGSTLGNVKVTHKGDVVCPR